MKNTTEVPNRRMPRCAALLCLAALLLPALASRVAAQTQYVFLYKDGTTYNFLYNNNTNTPGNTTTFDASTCVFTSNGTNSTTFLNGARYLYRYYGTLYTYTNETTWTIDNGRIYSGNTYYLYTTTNYLGNRSWGLSTTNSTNANYRVLYAYYSVPAGIAVDPIDGSDRLTVEGVFTYTTSGSYAAAHERFVGYSNTYYRVNNAMTETNPASAATLNWTLDNAGVDADLLTSTGGSVTVRINELPTTVRTMTLTCTASGGGYAAQTVTKQITVVPDGWTQSYVIFNGDGAARRYLGGTDRTPLTSFDPTCLWTGTSGGRWTNGSMYLRMGNNNNLTTTNSGNSVNMTLIGTGEGTSPAKIWYDAATDYYLRYDGTQWTRTTTATDAGTDVVYVAYGGNVAEVCNIDYSGVSVSAAINSSGVQMSRTGNATGSYTQAYDQYYFNNEYHYWYGNADHDAAPATQTLAFNHTWSIVDGADYAAIDATGLLTLRDNRTQDGTEHTITVRLTIEPTTGVCAEQYIDYTVKLTDHGTVVTLAATASPDELDGEGDASTITATGLGAVTPHYSVLKLGTDATAHYYYDGTDHTTAPADLSAGGWSYSWSLTDGASYSSLSGGSSNTTTLTYDRDPGYQSIARIHVVATNSGYTLTATCSVDLMTSDIVPPTITRLYSSLGRTDNINIACTDDDVDRIVYTVSYTGTAPADPTASTTTYVSPAGSSPRYPTTTTVITMTGSPCIVAARSVKGSALSTVVYDTFRLQLGKPQISIDCVNELATFDINAANSSISSDIDLYYTTDGSTPTAVTENKYNGGVDISDLDNEMLRVYAVDRTGAYEPSDEESMIYDMWETPVPHVHNTTAGVTFSCDSSYAGSPAGQQVTYYYTVNTAFDMADTASYTKWYDAYPPTGATASSAITGLSDGAVLRVVAVRGCYWPSHVVEYRYYTPSHVDATNGIVYLNDAEPHSWSYYSDPDSPVRSLNPADVTIMYYGNGKGTVSSTEDNTPAADSWTGNATTVQVGIDANANTFVYYKTLERTDGETATTVAGATGRCEYTTIPNPFSVRPVYGDAPTKASEVASTKWRGFYAWRVKKVTNGKIWSASSGGTEYTDTTNNIIPAETVVYFAPDNETGMVVELEALWAKAYLTTGTGSMSTVADGPDAYERNFHVITSTSATTASELQKNYRHTVSALYPNGTTNGYTTATTVPTNRRLSGSFAAGDTTKFEYIRFNPGTVYYAYARSGYAPGYWSATKQNSVNTYYYAYYYDGIMVGTHQVDGSNVSNTEYCANGKSLILGRGLEPYNSATYCIPTVYGSNDAADTRARIRIESGRYANLYLSYYDVMSFASTVNYVCTLGCDYDRANNSDNSKLVLPVSDNGGEIYGGKTIQVTAAANKENLAFDWNVKSGTFHPGDVGAAEGGNQSIYMGSSQSGTSGEELMYIGKRRILVEGGNLASIAGGMNTNTANGSGTGYNVNTTYTDPTTNDMVRVRVKGGTIRGSIYGAAAFAAATGGRRYVITGGTVQGWIAGGCNGTRTNGGEMFGSTFMYIGGKASCNSNGSTTYINSSLGGNVFGAGSGISGGTTVGQVYNSTVVIADEAEIERDVYGGGNYGYVNSGTGHKSDIYILGGIIHGNVFGGSNQQQGQDVNIKMTGGMIDKCIYGGSNSSGTINGNVSIDIEPKNETTTIEVMQGVFGGGRGTTTSACDIHGNVTIRVGGNSYILGGERSQWATLFDGNRGGVYGGGYINCSVSGDVVLNLEGGEYGDMVNLVDIHGGGMGERTRVLGNVTVNLGKSGDICSDYPSIFGDVYGGSAKGKTHYNTSNVQQSGKETKVNIYGGTVLGDIYGGGLGDSTSTTSKHAADVGGPVTVTMDGGSCGGIIYGGNNTFGSPKGNITVDIIRTCHIDGKDNYTYDTANVTTPGYALKAVYGGGNKADYTSSVATNHTYTYNDVNLTATVNVYGCEENTIEYVYGGGRAARVPATDVTIEGGFIGNIFAGGDGSAGVAANVGSPNMPTASRKGAKVMVTGGYIGSVFGGSNTTGEIFGPRVVDIDEHDPCDIVMISNLYGGGNHANITGDGSLVVKCGVGNIGNVYGGSNAADLDGNVVLNIFGGTIDNVYGGNHSSGKITGDVLVNIFGGDIGDVFGGCDRGGDIRGSIEVNVMQNDDACEIASINNVYGGGNQAAYSPEASVQAGHSPLVNVIHASGTIGNVFGGGKGLAARVTSSQPQVRIGTTVADDTVGLQVNQIDPAKDPEAKATFPAYTAWTVHITGSVYGGGNAAPLTGSTDVWMRKGLVEKNIFGGGLGSRAAVTGSATVKVTGSSEVQRNVYGGGYGGIVFGNTDVTVGE